MSERPLVADGENTVITSPEKKRGDLLPELTPGSEALRSRLFPSGGVSTGEEAGVRLAHYEIRERLGSGGMGAVFRASDVELARDIALKILNPGSSEDSSLVARFRNEARACAQLNHDNIARVYFAGSQDDLHFIAYEMAEGTTIKDLIQTSGQMSPEETVNYAIQVTLALNHIAAAGIVHRDIKPSNIMLTPAGRVKVVDLGLARRDVTDSIGDITVAGTTLGTFDYIAPEQARDPSSADIRSDIYSLGCTMYHMLTGQPPYPEGTALQKLLDHQGKSPPDPRSSNPSISAELAAVIKKMMANNAEQRYQAPALLLSDLLQLARMMGLQSIPAEGIVWRRATAVQHRQPMGAVWVFASVLAICITAVILERLPLSESGNVTSPIASDAELDATLVEDFSNSEESADALANASGLTTGLPPGGTSLAATRPAGTMAAEMLSGNGQPVSSGQPGTVVSESTDLPRAADGILPFSIESVRQVAINTANMAVATSGFDQLTGLGRVQSLQENGSINAGSSAQPPLTDLSSVFELQKEDGTVQRFQTLRGAIADARSGDVVLLRYNGHPAEMVTQPPVRISMIDLTIRAADGYRPILEFDASGTGAVSRTEMFTLRNGGTLTIRNIDLRMVMRESLAIDRCSMFRMDGPNRIQLDNVTIDFRNPSGLAGSIFDLIDPASVTDEISSGETSIIMNQVACRGEIDAIRVAGQPQGRITIQNSVFGLSGSLIQNIGSSTMLQTRGMLQIRFDHVTAILSEPLIDMRDSDEIDARSAPQRMLPDLSITSDACIFAAASANMPLVLSNGNAYVDDLQASLSWNGFTNLYSGYGSLWQVNTGGMDAGDSRRLDMAEWRQLWQSRGDGEERNGNMVEDLETWWVDAAWKTLPAFQPSAVTLDSFQLDASMFASHGCRFPLARDGKQPGAFCDELPRFPLVAGPKPVIQPQSNGALSNGAQNFQTPVEGDSGIAPVEPVLRPGGMTNPPGVINNASGVPSSVNTLESPTARVPSRADGNSLPQNPRDNDN